MKLRFRDGEREVPDHLAALLKDIDVRRLTFDEAVAAGNRRQMSDYLNKEQSRVVREHLDMQRRIG